MDARTILAELKAEYIAPDTALGGEARIRDRQGFLKKLEAQAKYFRVLLTLAYGAQILLPLIAVAIFYVWRPLAEAPSTLVAVGAGGVGTLIALLELSRRTTREYMTLMLAVDAAPHGTDAQLASLVASLVDALGAAQATRSASRKPAGAPPKAAAG